jgi:hypothetical protein
MDIATNIALKPGAAFPLAGSSQSSLVQRLDILPDIRSFIHLPGAWLHITTERLNRVS